MVDIAQHFLLKAGITALRRVRKSDNNRIALAVGATVVNRVEDLRESDVGTQCGLFNVEKLGDELSIISSTLHSSRPRPQHQTFPPLRRYFTFLTGCTNPKACTILLRGPSKDILNEIDRNLADAMAVARNVFFNPRLAPGGGATEMAVSVLLTQKARSVEGAEAWPFRAIAESLEVIPRTLIQNSGGNAIRVLTELRVRSDFISVFMKDSLMESRNVG